MQGLRTLAPFFIAPQSFVSTRHEHAPQISYDLQKTAATIKGMALAPGALLVTPSTAPPQTRAPLPKGCSGVRGRARGFTMLEVLTVVVIIGVLAATASPIMVSILRDRNVARMAMRVGDVYRFARALALERQAVLVRYNLVGGPAGSPGLEIREAVVLNAGAPAPTCAGTVWTNGSPQSKLVTSFPAAPANPAQNPPWEDAAVDFRDPAGANKAYAEICYTSRGATWIRYDPSDAFIALQGVPQIGVINTKTGMRRTVFIPPSTVARLAL